MKKNNPEILAEALDFDQQITTRIKHGFIPDLRKQRRVRWFYNNVWREPEFVRIHVMPQINKIILIARKRGGRVIEIGCGSGFLTLELARHNLDVTGVDISPKNIEVAKRYREKNRSNKNFGSLQYIHGDVTSMNLGDNKFDTVIFFGTLHHIRDLDKVLSKMHDAMKPNGNIIICEPVRGNITYASAEFAAIIRAILPTWIPYEKKLKKLTTPNGWGKYVQEIYDEYTFKGKNRQSTFDNVTSSEKIILATVKKYFQIKKIHRYDAFLDKIIGGLRGKDRYVLATFLKCLDDDLVVRKVLPNTKIFIHAVKTPQKPKRKK